ncbi:MAG: cupin domain-containing protein [Ignavibacteria bacterium]|nr:cupin domain-containing protein [Ignavibacteria bacterium]
MNRADKTDSLQNTIGSEWQPHPRFVGVWMSDIVTGQQTGGALSIHKVKVEPGRVLQTHVHESQTEIHEVVQGTGVCSVSTEERDYRSGVVSLIPVNTPHEVHAGEEGILLTATFFPALR